jgi:hypothetical protein
MSGLQREREREREKWEGRRGDRAKRSNRVLFRERKREKERVD